MSDTPVGPLGGAAQPLRIRDGGKLATTKITNEIADAFNRSQGFGGGVVSDPISSRMDAIVKVVSNSGLGGGVYRGKARVRSDRFISAAEMATTVSTADFFGTTEGVIDCFVFNWLEAGQSTHVLTATITDALTPGAFPAVQIDYAEDPSPPTSDSPRYLPIYHIWAGRLKGCPTP